MLKSYGNCILIAFFLLVIFEIYIYTTYPAFKNDDSPETITSAYTLGISHPPGYPLFTIAGKVFSLLPLGSPAFRMNLFSIFLSMLVLLLSYLIIKQITFRIFSYNDKIISFAGIFVLAFSYIFWNQAIEAKGGVFIFNLLFFSILIYLGMRLLNNYNIKNLYLMSYIYGISLANHWASMIILLPVFGYFFFKYRKKIISKNIILFLLFLIIGISAYIYLPLRSGTDGIFIFLLKPDSWHNFWWTVMRSAYTAAPPPSLKVYAYQIKEFFILLFRNYSILWILIFPGIYVMRKKYKGIIYLLLSVFSIITFVIIIYNRERENMMWLIDVILVPAQYVLMLFIITGINALLEFRKQMSFKYPFISIIFALILFMGCVNFKRNNNKYNYISYDFINNVIQTLEPDSFLLSEGDNNLRLCYIQKIQHRAEAVKLINVNSLESWGIDNFQKKYGDLNLKTGIWTANAINIINNFSNKYPIYMESYVETFENNMNNFVEKPKGIFYKIVRKEENISPAIFDTYSYRGIYNTHELLDKELSSFYGSMMCEKGKEFLRENKYYEAVKLFKKAATFPAENDIKANIYFLLACVYKIVSDRNDERACLEKTIVLKPDFWLAYQAAGISYYQDKKLLDAKYMFEQAIKYASPDTQMIEQYISAINKKLDNSQ